MPEAGAGGVSQESAPPLLVGERADPALERVEVVPVLAPAAVRREKRIPQRLVSQ